MWSSVWVQNTRSLPAIGLWSCTGHSLTLLCSTWTAYHSCRKERTFGWVVIDEIARSQSYIDSSHSRSIVSHPLHTLVHTLDILPHSLSLDEICSSSKLFSSSSDCLVLSSFDPIWSPVDSFCPSPSAVLQSYVLQVYYVK